MKRQLPTYIFTNESKIRILFSRPLLQFYDRQILVTTGIGLLTSPTFNNFAVSRSEHQQKDHPLQPNPNHHPCYWWHHLWIDPWQGLKVSPLASSAMTLFACSLVDTMICRILYSAILFEFICMRRYIVINLSICYVNVCWLRASRVTIYWIHPP